MSMDSFDELQTVLRLFYSRPSTAFGQPKKKLRRVVSTSNASIADRLAAVESLGICNGATSQPCPDSRVSERKHDLDATPEYPVKRCRRVVSELPPTSLGSLFENSSDDPPPDFSDAGTAPFWALGCTGRIVGTSAALNQSSVHQLALQQSGPVDMRLPLLLPTFDGPAHPNPSIYELSVAATHGLSAATLNAATMAAIAGFEEALSSPMVHATECMPMTATAGDSSFGFVASGFMPTFHSGTIQPACAEMMSAFAAAAAAAAAASPACSPCDPGNSIGSAIGAAAAEECNQALVEAFGRYYADSTMGGTPDMQFPFCTWSEDGAVDGILGETTTTARSVSTSDHAPRARLGIHAQTTRPVAAEHAVSPCAQSIPEAASYSASVSGSRLSVLTSEIDSASISVQNEHLVVGKVSEHTKDLRSSPSCTQSMHSISRASDATLTIRGGSDDPVINGASEDTSDELLRPLEPDVTLACGNISSSPVIDWLYSLKNILDAHDVGTHLFTDNAYSVGPHLDNDNGGNIWPFAFVRNPGGTE
ncbi:hypothetical protein GGI24_001716 [Coemansia furcata]|nr:hypothetical protein GGI24_001716 [Coemansia furcata]